MTVTARYDEIADFYEAATQDEVTDPAAQALLDLLGDVTGLTVLDLACGHGRMTRELARRGARATGADISGELLDKARAAENDNSLGVRYLQADATAPESLDIAGVDAVSCNYGLSDIDDLTGALVTVRRVLRPEGLFVFSILHPCFPGWGEDAPSAWPPDDGYYREGWWLAENTGFRGKVGSNFRMVSTYFNALIGHGFVIDAVGEPEPPPGWPRIPYALVVRCRRSG